MVDPSRTVWQSTRDKWWLTHWASLLRWISSISEYNLTIRDSPKWTLESGPGHLCVWLGLTWSVGIQEVSQNWPSKMRNGIVYHKSDRKPCVIPTADRNTIQVELRTSQCENTPLCHRENSAIRFRRYTPLHNGEHGLNTTCLQGIPPAAVQTPSDTKILHHAKQGSLEKVQRICVCMGSLQVWITCTWHGLQKFSVQEEFPSDKN